MVVVAVYQILGKLSHHITESEVFPSNLGLHLCEDDELLNNFLVAQMVNVMVLRLPFRQLNCASSGRIFLTTLFLYPGFALLEVPVGILIKSLPIRVEKYPFLRQIVTLLKSVVVLRVNSEE
jgi:hypothetical protein